jgi:DNA-binding transcriptional regulator YiaG
MVLEMREKLGLSGKDFAALMGISGAVVSVWERKKGPINLHSRSRQALEIAWQAASRADRQKH